VVGELAKDDIQLLRMFSIIGVAAGDVNLTAVAIEDFGLAGALDL